MCKKTNYKGTSNTRIDECMRTLITNLNVKGIKTVACCCGHGKYPMTIIVEGHYDLVSGKFIPRKRKFYKRDKEGFYYIPEVIEK